MRNFITMAQKVGGPLHSVEWEDDYDAFKGTDGYWRSECGRLRFRVGEDPVDLLMRVDQRELSCKSCLRSVGPPPPLCAEDSIHAHAMAGKLVDALQVTSHVGLRYELAQTGVQLIVDGEPWELVPFETLDLCFQHHRITPEWHLERLRGALDRHLARQAEQETG